MLPIGRINKAHAAQVFCDHLAALGISADWLPEGPMFVVRVSRAEQAEAARVELQRFLQSPDAAHFRHASWQHGDASKAPPTATPAAPIIAQFLARSGPLTIALVAMSLLATIATAFGSREALTYYLWFHLPSIFAGQIHRLLTPIFVHMDVLHLLFNMMWLWDLGGIIEQRLRSRHLLLLVLAIGIISNFFQYVFSGPYFGGMSGVVYGLLGYLWLRGRIDQSLGLRLNPSIVWFMLGLLLLCFTGVMGPVANAAHVAGLLSGMVLGLLMSLGRARV